MILQCKSATQVFVRETANSKLQKMAFARQNMREKNKNSKSGNTEPCRMWAHGKIRFGSKCRYGHDGPGAALQKKPSSETLTVHDGSACYYCNKKGHAMRDCHKKQEDEDIKAAKAASKVNLADATEGINYVYMSHVTTDQNTIK
jgi:hypothetical protein